MQHFITLENVASVQISRGRASGGVETLKIKAKQRHAAVIAVLKTNSQHLIYSMTYSYCRSKK